MPDEKPPKKKSKLKWIILILLLLLLAGGGAAAWFLFLQDRFMPPADAGAATEQAEVLPEPTYHGVTVPLGTFTTNLADPLGQKRIRLVVEVEFTEAKYSDSIKRHSARVRDAILMLLSTKKAADVLPPENRTLLKNEITDRLNTILGQGRVFQVFITDLVVD